MRDESVDFICAAEMIKLTWVQFGLDLDLAGQVQTQIWNSEPGLGIRTMSLLSYLMTLKYDRS